MVIVSNAVITLYVMGITQERIGAGVWHNVTSAQHGSVSGASPAMNVINGLLTGKHAGRGDVHSSAMPCQVHTTCCLCNDVASAPTFTMLPVQ